MSEKTEFLFESDAEKVIIKRAIEEEKKKAKKKTYKNILFNSFLMIFIIVGFTFGINYFSDLKLNKLAEEINKSSVPEENMNESSNMLEYYSNNNSSKYEILINKANPITEEKLSEYKIVNVENNVFDDIRLEEETYNNYLTLKDNLKQKGYYINIRSGYRTFLESNKIFNEYKNNKGLDYANKYVAKAGTSEHNTGLAMDIVISTDENSITNNYDSDEYFYLENIAYVYGFIIRYPKDKEEITGYSYEPWHLRYVGKDLAKYMKKNNLCLEEYWQTK